ncbi:tRNA glutamyl-Q(34) synthetase GluQRS [Marinomonas dokdonensis]|uniref:tRNA glutamyl-Q(34) synthetase GluQRS n=1 Tax=Marinomonas dokdonensis TaxID=328224 RepID=UPI0040557BAA
MSTPYRGRFAPSPTGPLHFGSLVSALASYLDARQHNGQWVIRIEDVDGTRCTPAYSQQILTTLSSYHLESDEAIRYQSQHSDLYEHYLEQLKQADLVFPCNCTRKNLAKHQGLHPNICPSQISQAHSWRLKTSNTLYQYTDRIQGLLSFTEDLKHNCPVLKRKDDFFSYQLAVVVDDHLQGISHLVRGADLIETTAQQLYLYDIFGWPIPSIGHIPLVVNSQGDKISKQNHAKAIMDGDLQTLLRALSYLGIQLEGADNIQHALSQAIPLWSPERLANITQMPLASQDQTFI